MVCIVELAKLRPAGKRRRVAPMFRRPAAVIQGCVAGLLLAAILRAAAFDEYEVPCDKELLKVSVGDGTPRNGAHWTAQHESFTQTAGNEASELQLVIYGDSITENLGDMPDQLEVYRDMFATEAFGVGGDKTQNLLYRLQNGEWAAEMTPQFVVIMIGINNILHAFDDEGGKLSNAQEEEIASQIADDIEQMAAYIQRQSCRSQILLHALLPTAHEVDNEWPNRYSAAVEDRNRKVQRLADEHENVHYIDCMDLFLEESGEGQRIRLDRMPDLLHPGEEGHEAMAKCVTEHVGKVLEGVLEEAMVVQFGTWGDCSAECGGGVRTRKSSCGIKTDFTSGLDLSLTTELLTQVCSGIEVDPMDLISLCNTEACPSPPAPPSPDAPGTPPGPDPPGTPPSPDVLYAPEPSPAEVLSPQPVPAHSEEAIPAPETSGTEDNFDVNGSLLEPTTQEASPGWPVENTQLEVLPTALSDLPEGHGAALPAWTVPLVGLPSWPAMPPAAPQWPPPAVPQPPQPAVPPAAPPPTNSPPDQSEGTAAGEPQTAFPYPQFESAVNPWAAGGVDSAVAGSPVIASPIGNISNEFAAGNYGELPVPAADGTPEPPGVTIYMVAAVIAIGACGVLSLAGALVFYLCLMHKMHRGRTDRADLEGSGKCILEPDEASDPWPETAVEGIGR